MRDHLPDDFFRLERAEPARVRAAALLEGLRRVLLAAAATLEEVLTEFFCAILFTSFRIKRQGGGEKDGERAPPAEGDKGNYSSIGNLLQAVITANNSKGGERDGEHPDVADGKAHPKAKPLAMALVEAAARQGASAKELRLACVMAQEAYRLAMDNSRVPVTEFERDAKAALERI